MCAAPRAPRFRDPGLASLAHRLPESIKSSPDRIVERVAPAERGKVVDRNNLHRR